MTQQNEPQKVYVTVPEKKTNGLGVAGFVLSLIALFTSWIPILGWFVLFLGGLLSFIGLFRNPKGFAIAGFVISIVAFLIMVFATTLFAALGAG